VWNRRYFPDSKCSRSVKVTTHLHIVPRSRTRRRSKKLKSSLCSFLHAPVASSVSGSNIILGTLFITHLEFSNPLQSRTVHSPVYCPWRNSRKYFRPWTEWPLERPQMANYKE
jgi:hypothetical protein